MGARFSRAQPRARPYSARQSIALIMKMILNILILSVSLKIAEMSFEKSHLEKRFENVSRTSPFPNKFKKKNVLDKKILYT